MVESRNTTGRWGIEARTKGTPQGGVISPLLANLYMHHAFDMWMSRHFSGHPLSVMQTTSSYIATVRKKRNTCWNELELHPEKTKLVYCKCWKRKEKHEHNAFTFLSYSFQPRAKMNTFGRRDKFTVFNAAICSKAKAFIREKIRGVFNPRNTQVPLDQIAKKRLAELLL